MPPAAMPEGSPRHLLALFGFDTERLRLRAMEASDEAFFCSLYADPQTMRFIGPPLSVERVVMAFRRIINGLQAEFPESLHLIMRRRDTGQPVGLCGVPRCHAGATRLEVGLVLAPGEHSRGYAREGLAALTDRIFAKTSVGEVWARCSAEHHAAQHLCMAVGFSPCMDAMEQGASESTQIWAVRRDAWASRGFGSSRGMT